MCALDRAPISRRLCRMPIQCTWSVKPVDVITTFIPCDITYYSPYDALSTTFLGWHTLKLYLSLGRQAVPTIVIILVFSKETAIRTWLTHGNDFVSRKDMWSWRHMWESLDSRKDLKYHHKPILTINILSLFDILLRSTLDGFKVGIASHHGVLCIAYVEKASRIPRATFKKKLAPLALLRAIPDAIYAVVFDRLWGYVLSVVEDRHFWRSVPLWLDRKASLQGLSPGKRVYIVCN